MTLEETDEVADAPPPDADPWQDMTELSLVVTDVRMFCGGQQMLDEREKALIWFLIQHARWPVEEVLQEAGDGVYEMVFTMAPEEEQEDQGFAIVGRLSELYTRMFYVGTSMEEGTTQLTIDIEPGTLPRLVPTDMQSDRLPLWHIRLSPNDSASNDTPSPEKDG